jgi:hypothetical protein
MRERRRSNPQPENLFDDMLAANYVDFADASVLLVFEDGEQICHTFPLAAREGRAFFLCANCNLGHFTTLIIL